MVSYSSPRSLPLPSPPPLATATITKAGKRRAGLVSIDRLSSAALTRTNGVPVPSSMTITGAGVPSLYFAGT